jgi:preprotein translocase subunit SecB
MNILSIPKLKDMFQYEYKGGGYFRLKGVPKNKVAPILHGEEAVKFVYDKIVKILVEKE